MHWHITSPWSDIAHNTWTRKIYTVRYFSWLNTYSLLPQWGKNWLNLVINQILTPSESSIWDNNILILLEKIFVVSPSSPPSSWEDLGKIYDLRQLKTKLSEKFEFPVTPSSPPSSWEDLGRSMIPFVKILCFDMLFPYKKAICTCHMNLRDSIAHYYRVFSWLNARRKM